MKTSTPPPPRGPKIAPQPLSSGANLAVFPKTFLKRRLWPAKHFFGRCTPDKRLANPLPLRSYFADEKYHVFNLPPKSVWNVLLQWETPCIPCNYLCLYGFVLSCPSPSFGGRNCLSPLIRVRKFLSPLIGVAASCTTLLNFFLVRKRLDLKVYKISNF